MKFRFFQKNFVCGKKCVLASNDGQLDEITSFVLSQLHKIVNDKFVNLLEIFILN